MDFNELYARADQEAAELGSAAIPADLARGTGDAEVGAELLADCLAHEIAACHKLELRLTAAANDVLDWAETAGEVTAKDIAADLAAARLAAAAGRLLEQTRLGLVALARLRPPSEAEGVWQVVSFDGTTVSAEEIQRRIAAARAAKAANAPPARQPSARAEAVRAAALETAAEFAAEAGVADIAAVGADARHGMGFLRRLFSHALAAGHGLMMRLTGRTGRAFDHARAAQREPTEAQRLVQAAARLAERVRRGILAWIELAQARQGAGGMVWGGPDRISTAGHGVLPQDPPAAPAAG